MKIKCTSLAYHQLFRTMHNSLMDELRELIPPHISLNTWITEKLDISASSASRKITGTTPFNMREISKILAVFPNLASCLIPTSERKTLLTGQFVDFNSRTEVANYLQTISRHWSWPFRKGGAFIILGEIYRYFTSFLRHCSSSTKCLYGAMIWGLKA